MTERKYDYIIRANDIADSLEHGFINGYEQGLTTHIKSFDRRFRWMRGHVIVFFGIPGNGKSTVLNQMLILRAINDDEKFVFWTPEYSPTDFFYLDLIHTYTGKSPHKMHNFNKLSLDEFNEARDFIDKHFYFIEPDKRGDSPKSLNEKFERAFGDFGATTYITDPFNKLQHAWQSQNGRDDRYLGEFLDYELRFAQDHKVSKVVVMHTNGTVTTDDNGNFKCPHYFQIAGGAMTSNRVDDIIAIHRPNKETNAEDTTMLFSSKKIKKQQICGYEGDAYVAFDRVRNRVIDRVSEGSGDDKETVLRCPFEGYKKWKEYDPDVPDEYNILEDDVDLPF